MKQTSTPMPAYFLSHGGGPAFFMDAQGQPPLSSFDKNSATTQWYKDFHKNHVPRKPSAIVVISAHWEEKGIAHITAKPNPKLYFDYYGFPPETYQLTYPAPGDTQLASKIHNLLSSAGIPSKLDPSRDWDHGVFVPLILMYPEADVPIVQVSLLDSLDPNAHIKIGEALKSLRYEDVLIFGSGFATHNMRAIRGAEKKSIVPWINWLTETVTNDATKEEKKKKLINWSDAPGARYAHPREEHLIPLHVAFGSSDGKAELIYNFMNEDLATSFASYKFL